MAGASTREEGVIVVKDMTVMESCDENEGAGAVVRNVSEWGSGSDPFRKQETSPASNAADKRFVVVRGILIYYIFFNSESDKN
mmetsp:Transcript_146/g.136  ORF Transcript_146/g.136 Transcript_146/m.136 type:complete len:83 (+) Transcript_146:364-612(+)